ncbi:polysaccharide deacetylase family protein [Niallia sp. XMNu-256]|uniref:polysaccharide deacetylase family protein n=1 Tax=Niallia sp. XMNu-256 TaxID=3082444 RepID=UPI0030CE1F57
MKVKKHYNFIFTALFIFHFGILSYFIINNFDSIVSDEIVFARDQELEIDHHNGLRTFDSLKENEKAEKIPVLMYHKVIAEEDLSEDIHYNKGKLLSTIVTLEQFEKQMEFLHDNNFVTLTLKEFQAFMDRKIDVPKNSILITFDDGWKDNFTNAYLILDKYDFKATIFLITDKIENKQETYIPGSTQYLSRQDIIDGNNVFSYSSHTHNFHSRDENDLAFLVSKDNESIKKDIQRSIDMIGDNTAFAYPYGEFNQETIKVLEELNVPMAFTIHDKGMVHPDDNRFTLSRRGIYPSTTIEVFKNLVMTDVDNN